MYQPSAFVLDPEVCTDYGVAVLTMVLLRQVLLGGQC